MSKLTPKAMTTEIVPVARAWFVTPEGQEEFVTTSKVVLDIGRKLGDKIELLYTEAALQAAREEGARMMQVAASEACLDIWQKADNVRPTYTQNAISHGCLASSKAIHTISISEVLAKGKT